MNMSTDQFRNNMATIRTALKNSTGTRATVLCMVVAATRGHVHCAHVWQRLDGWRPIGATVGTPEGQRAFVEANAPDPWGSSPLSDEERQRCVDTIAAADEYRTNWARRLAEVADAEKAVLAGTI